jgi:flagellar export protein FliJ
MKSYRFPFHTVRRIRAIHRDEQRLRLADAFRAQELLDQQQRRLRDELGELQNEQRAAMQLPEPDVNDLLAAQRYELVLRAQQQAVEKQSAMLAEEVERRRQSLVEAEREVRVIDKLDERLQAVHRANQQRADTKRLDEIAQQKVAARRR